MLQQKKSKRQSALAKNLEVVTIAGTAGIQ